jgi:hypothetical protein
VRAATHLSIFRCVKGEVSELRTGVQEPQHAEGAHVAGLRQTDDFLVSLVQVRLEEEVQLADSLRLQARGRGQEHHPHGHRSSLLTLLLGNIFFNPRF